MWIGIERDGEEQTLTLDLPGLGDILLPDDFDWPERRPSA